jgi:hypothetical protein
MANQIDVQPAVPTTGIPNADNSLRLPVETPYVAPTVVTSLMARRKAMKDLAELSRLTGKQYTL